MRINLTKLYVKQCLDVSQLLKIGMFFIKGLKYTRKDNSRDYTKRLNMVIMSVVWKRY